MLVHIFQKKIKYVVNPQSVRELEENQAWVLSGRKTLYLQESKRLRAYVDWPAGSQFILPWSFLSLSCIIGLHPFRTGPGCGFRLGPFWTWPPLSVPLALMLHHPFSEEWRCSFVQVMSWTVAGRYCLPVLCSVLRIQTSELAL
ncbi:hypothetical protein U1Q18_043653 [Sarracenia purpurea var. burkii]